MAFAVFQQIQAILPIAVLRFGGPIACQRIGVEGHKPEDCALGAVQQSTVALAQRQASALIVPLQGAGHIIGLLRDGESVVTDRSPLHFQLQQAVGIVPITGKGLQNIAVRNAVAVVGGSIRPQGKTHLA